MKYVEFINQLLRGRIGEEKNNLVIFGQNISRGSCLSGLTRDLRVQHGSVINTPNSENTLCGAGFGLMLDGVSSVLFLKQQDFLLLGIDQLVNTYNIVRQKRPLASFTIVTIVMDHGFEGPQHSFNSFGDICSMARIPGFSITNNSDAKEIITSQLIRPGFRIIGISQRLFKKEIIEVEKVYSNNGNTLFQYSKGSDVTIACFNFSLPYGFELASELIEKGLNPSLFSINSLTPIAWDKIVEDLKETKKLVVIDDSKSENLSCYNFLVEALDKCQIDKKIIITKNFSEEWFIPNPDQFKINYEKIRQQLQL